VTPRLRAVTFDFWDTLVGEQTGTTRTHQLRRWSEILADAGTPVPDRRLVDAFARNWEVFHERWHTNVQHGAPQATPLICKLLEVDPPADVRRALVEAFAEAGRKAPLHLAPGIGATLRALRAAGIRIGIVCDVGMTPSPTLRDRLAAFELLDLFDHWSFSDEVGCFKPWPDVFRHALAGLDVDDPGAAAHVGDSRRTDVAGALFMGMTAVRYTGFSDAPADSGPEAHLVLDDHERLPLALGV
jgi:putative hydrolase of the HAD superfamily